MGKKRNRRKGRQNRRRASAPSRPRRRRRDWRMTTFYVLGILIVISMAVSLVFPFLQ